MALKMDAPAIQEPQPTPPPTPPKPTAPPVAAVPEKKSALPVVIGIVVMLLLVSGGFIYFSRDLLFPKPTNPVPTPPTPVVKEPPSSAASLTVAISGSAASLNWVDTSGNETGYRIERKEGQGTYLPITNLPGNSTVFLDASAQAGKSYTYRIVALGEGGEASPSNESSVSMPEAPAPVIAGPSLPPGGLDSDSDGLSDQEEALFSTDPQKPDSDGDSYNDGNEVFHLYNPAVKAPSRLVDSGLVAVLSAPAGWSMFVPKRWTTGLDVPDGSHATIASGQGESLIVQIVDNPEQKTLLDWYLAQNPGVTSSDVRSFTTKGGLAGIFSQDRLTAYFAWESKILSIQYNLNGQKFVNYRTVFEMMLNSLTLNGAPVVSVQMNPAETGPGTLIGTTSTAPLAPTSTQPMDTEGFVPESTTTSNEVSSTTP